MVWLSNGTKSQKCFSLNKPVCEPVVCYIPTHLPIRPVCEPVVCYCNIDINMYICDSSPRKRRMVVLAFSSACARNQPAVRRMVFKQTNLQRDTRGSTEYRSLGREFAYCLSEQAEICERATLAPWSRPHGVHGGDRWETKGFGSKTSLSDPK